MLVLRGYEGRTLKLLGCGKLRNKRIEENSVFWKKGALEKEEDGHEWCLIFHALATLAGFCMVCILNVFTEKRVERDD
ncbi:hypothetical protein DITRI_Ditri14bG0004700 [Diplodiscus trichospermus]